MLVRRDPAAVGGALDGARIVFACDAYSAMLSGRPYAGALTVERAIDELRSCAGSQFDPTVIAALSDVLNHGERSDRDLSRRGNGAQQRP